MDWLIRVEDTVARGVFDADAHLLNHDVDLIFFDTTSTYFQTEQPDPAIWRDDRGRVLYREDDREEDREEEPTINGSDGSPTRPGGGAAGWGGAGRGGRPGGVSHVRQVQGCLR